MLLEMLLLSHAGIYLPTVYLRPGQACGIHAHATGMARVACIMGKFFKVVNFPYSCVQALIMELL